MLSVCGTCHNLQFGIVRARKAGKPANRHASLVRYFDTCLSHSVSPRLSHSLDGNMKNANWINHWRKLELRRNMRRKMGEENEEEKRSEIPRIKNRRDIYWIAMLLIESRILCVFFFVCTFDWCKAEPDWLALIYDGAISCSQRKVIDIFARNTRKLIEWVAARVLLFQRFSMNGQSAIITCIANDCNFSLRHSEFSFLFQVKIRLFFSQWESFREGDFPLIIHRFIRRMSAIAGSRNDGPRGRLNWSLVELEIVMKTLSNIECACTNSIRAKSMGSFNCRVPSLNQWITFASRRKNTCAVAQTKRGRTANVSFYFHLRWNLRRNKQSLKGNGGRVPCRWQVNRSVIPMRARHTSLHIKY